MSRLESALDAYHDCIIDEADLKQTLYGIIRDDKADDEECKRAALYYHFRCWDKLVVDSGFDFQVNDINYTVSEERIEGLKLEGKVNAYFIYIAEEQPGN